ncbi:MAG: hypothetical protein JHC95_06365 [Solirubrobacteraceae bacterium]|nr:hypothetical protein [Solirubrobacteraceae bacterium]
MDKAKKMAEQAQAKVDEVQKQFNESQGSTAGAGAPSDKPVVQYDTHGRPIPPDPPIAPGTGEPPAPEGPTVGAPVPGAAPAPAPAPPPAAPPAASADDGPPPMTSGDPLAG